MKYTILSANDDYVGIKKELSCLEMLIGPFEITRVKQSFAGDLVIYVKKK